MKLTRPSLMACVFLAGCCGNNTGPQVTSPGEPTSPGLSALSTGAGLVQARPPIAAINTYLDGFHFYSGDRNGQMEAHHYVTVLNDDVMQAVIYDGNTRDARLMGIEYIISERLYKGLPAEEKRLWHSHRYEVKSGTLIAPGLPAPLEKQLMARIVNTYGKTWHTWHTDRDKTLPLGIPALMMGFTADGQLDPRLLADRDRRFGTNTQSIKQSRQDLRSDAVDPQADAWQKGHVIQLKRVAGGGEHAKGTTSFSTSERVLKHAKEHDVPADDNEM
ncbi:OBAP family protein (plasmid) [Erwinia persicina]|uniref:OBAP family protein n=1 Tax=Erwinia persicina TaxID=55211 RepID=UPI00210C1067|nr:OBAP family protein [Erwinia persicina]MCQ4095913.1 OBAP family protein [Erwinia persicina]MCQ4102452.1 OBAP family protein [Erwinia persicina]